MRALVAASCVMALMTAQMSEAHAANGCFGCNVADEGVFDSGLIGDSVYVESGGGWGVVRDISRNTGEVLVSFDNGGNYWVSAYSTYTSASKDERNVATAGAGIAVLGLLFGAMASGGGGGGGSYGSSNSSNAYDQQYELQRRNPPPPYYPPPPPPTSGFYGNCHGGAAYGC